MGKKSTIKKKHQLVHRHTRSQNGGIKVLLPDMYSPVMEREIKNTHGLHTILSNTCLLYTSPSPRDRQKSRMPSSA